MKKSKEEKGNVYVVTGFYDNSTFYYDQDDHHYPFEVKGSGFHGSFRTITEMLHAMNAHMYHEMLSSLGDVLIMLTVGDK